MSETDPRWQVLSNEVVFSARPFLEISRQQVALPNGRRIPDFHQAWIVDYVIICAETDQGDVVMERLYKHGVRDVTLIFPGGGIAHGEDPLVAAQRELLEETGYKAAQWTLLKKLVVHANYGCGHAHFYHAKGAKLVQPPSHDDLEDIEVELHPRSKLGTLVENGSIALVDCMAMLGALSLMR